MKNGKTEPAKPPFSSSGHEGSGKFEDISHSAWVADYRGGVGLGVGVVATACCLCRGHVPGSFKRKTHHSTSLTALSLPKGGTKSVPWLPLLLACAISAPADEPGKIRFEEIATKVGVRHIHHTRKFTGKNVDVLGMFTSGGASAVVGDYDYDGHPSGFQRESCYG